MNVKALVIMVVSLSVALGSVAYAASRPNLEQTVTELQERVVMLEMKVAEMNSTKPRMLEGGAR